jgi:glycosyltransferase involved in cell wall biosynthesis
MRIMMVTDFYAPMVGGVPTVTHSITKGLAQRGHSVALVAPSPGWIGRQGTEERVSVHLRGSVNWPFYEGTRLGCLPGPAARKLIAGFAPNVIHIHSPLTLGIAALAAGRRLRIPVVYTNHSLPVNARPSIRQPPWMFDVVFYAFIVGFANRCSHVTAPSATALRLLHDRGLRAPAQVISNGVDLVRYSPGLPDDRLRARYGLTRGRSLILSVGRLSPEKRMDVLLEAAAQLTQDAELAIAGVGPCEAALRAAVSRLGLATRVRFLGQVLGQDLPGLYRLADVYAIASEAELQSLATMEAMATGLPVVAVDAYALTELVHAGRNGFLAARGRSREMAAYLDILLADPSRRADMGAASLRIISTHGQHRVLLEWEKLYRLLDAAEPTGRRR